MVLDIARGNRSPDRAARCDARGVGTVALGRITQLDLPELVGRLPNMRVTIDNHEVFTICSAFRGGGSLFIHLAPTAQFVPLPSGQAEP